MDGLLIIAFGKQKESKIYASFNAGKKYLLTESLNTSVDVISLTEIHRLDVWLKRKETEKKMKERMRRQERIVRSLLHVFQLSLNPNVYIFQESIIWYFRASCFHASMKRKGAAINKRP